jgi:hypothetical protein
VDMSLVFPEMPDRMLLIEIDGGQTDLRTIRESSFRHLRDFTTPVGGKGGWRIRIPYVHRKWKVNHDHKPSLTEL